MKNDKNSPKVITIFHVIIEINKGQKMMHLASNNS